MGHMLRTEISEVGEQGARNSHRLVKTETWGWELSTRVIAEAVKLR